MKSFVTAYWSDLILLSYAVPDDVLAPYVGDFELDRWNGSAYISIVAFHFGKTRVMGIPPGPLFPRVGNFAQWNLRTYVTHGTEPGIVFIKEFVPSQMVTQFVRGVYHENYQAAPVDIQRSCDNGSRRVRYDLRVGGRRHSLSVSSREEAVPVEPQSTDYFFAERYWGSPGSHATDTITFRVSHAPWRTFKVASYVLTADFGALYGDSWRFLDDRSPDYVTWCNGSPVGISWPTRKHRK